MQELFSNNLKKVRAQAMDTKQPGYRRSRAVAPEADDGASAYPHRLRSPAGVLASSLQPLRVCLTLAPSRVRTPKTD